MALVPLNLPPGVYRNGTDLQSAGRWRDASLVRWTDGTMQPVGGWLTRATMTDQPLRGAIAWRDLSGDRWFAAGSFEGLFASNVSNTTGDITPAGYTAGLARGAQNLGYGGGAFGTGAYGIPRPDTGTYLPAATWALDTWGQNLVACSSSDGQLLEWALALGTPAAPITNAPTGCGGLFVTEERFLFALAPGGNGRKVAWCDREDNTTWAADATNEAGDIELQTSGEVLLGIKTRGQALILTTQDAHTATYQGPPFVYGFERVGTSCGAISRLCAASVSAGVFWMGERGFFNYSGGAVQELQCDVLDHVFSDLNRTQRSLVAAVPNAQFSEIWWFYPSAGSSENDRYVAFNYRENHWSVGQLARTCGVDAGVFSTPVWFTPDGKAINHEIGTQRDGQAVYAQSGPVQLGNGDAVMAVTSLIPDEKTQGDVTATFAARFYPNDIERSYGPFSMAAPTNVRFTGRQVALTVTGANDSGWRWGVPRIEAKSGGLR